MIVKGHFEKKVRTHKVGKRNKYARVKGNRVSDKVDRLKKKSTEATINQGEELFKRMSKVLFSGPTSIDGMVAMTYALSRCHVELMLLLKDFCIDGEPYIRNMINFWRPIMEAEWES